MKPLNTLNNQSLPEIGNVNYQNISPYEIPVLFKQLFDLKEYKNICPIKKPSLDKTIISNEEFWTGVISRNIFQGQLIKFKEFDIIEWAPFSPGLFYSFDAQRAREEAEQYSSSSHNEYTPMGKISMIKGGVGSIRLQPKLIRNISYNILGITSTGISHEGIPLIMEDAIYNKIIGQIKSNGGITANIIGRVVLMPENNVVYSGGVPKYCIEVEELNNIQKTMDRKVLITVAIAYRTTDNLDLSWTYKTIRPDKRDVNLKHASEWILQYMDRYAKTNEKPSILHDYDEHVTWFPSTDFSVKNVIENKELDTKLLKKYIEKYNIIVGNNIIIGNNNIIINDVHDSTIEINNGK